MAELVVARDARQEKMDLSSEHGSTIIHEQFNILSSFQDVIVIPNKNSSRKLARLTLGQLKELLTDICDEIERRKSTATNEPFLPIRLDYSPKRNQARQKLADLTSQRFSQLVSSVKIELERRFPHLDAEANANKSEEKLDEKFEQLARSLAALPTMGDNYASSDNGRLSDLDRTIEPSITSSIVECGVNTELSTPKAFEAIRPSCERDAKHGGDHSGYPIEERLAKGQTFNFDCLESLINDLNTIIGQEQNCEVESMRERHSQEIAQLKKYIQHVEDDIIPSKNHEIAKLTTRVEELEGRVAAARREHAACSTKLAEKEKFIDEQAAILKTIQESYMQLQKQVASSSLLTSPNKSDQGETLKLASSGSAFAVNVIGVYSAIWSAFSKIHEKAVAKCSQTDTPFGEKLQAMKESFTLAQKLIKESERLINQMDTAKMPWILEDMESLIAEKSQCMQCLSYAIICCKDMKGNAKAGKEIQEALSTLFHAVRSLVDVSELVASRAQIPSSPRLLEASKEKLEADHSSSDAKRRTIKTQTFADLARLMRGSFTENIAAFGMLRNYIESSDERGHEKGILELPQRIRSSLATAMAWSVDLVQQCRMLLHSSPNQKATETLIISLAENLRKIQQNINNGNGIMMKESILNSICLSCVKIIADMQQLEQICQSCAEM